MHRKRSGAICFAAITICSHVLPTSVRGDRSGSRLGQTDYSALEQSLGSEMAKLVRIGFAAKTTECVVGGVGQTSEVESFQIIEEGERTLGCER